MSQLKQNWKVLTLAVLSCATAVFGWSFLHFGTMSTAQVGEGGGELTVVDKSDIQTLLATIDLDRDCMAALNPSAQQASDLMGAVVNWWATDGATWKGLNANAAHQRNAVRQLERAAKMGTADGHHEEDLATARAALASANSAAKSHENSLRSTLASLMSDTQQSTWSVIQHGWGGNMPVRMLELSHQQRQDYARGLRHHELAMAAAQSQDERNTLEAAWVETVNTILTPDNRQVITDWETNAAEAYAAVNDAMASAFGSEG
ncbi:MAG TPA: hypothetical protein PKN33_03175 [Phycisphaerae bacterium]|nr:hypothetical protein [Phycisphaerae bacterium]